MASTADRHFIWGLRYIDDLVLRDRAAERLYALQDANWNITAVASNSAIVQERYRYNVYGLATVLNPDFSIRTGTMFDWETRYAGYRSDNESGLYQIRYRYLHYALGVWLTRDPVIANSIELYTYILSGVLTRTDPLGLRDYPMPELGAFGTLLGLLEGLVGSGWALLTSRLALIGLGVLGLIILALGTACIIKIVRVCNPQFRLCVQSALQQADTDASTQCPNGFRDRAFGRLTCIKRYYSKYESQCKSEWRNCAFTCGISGFAFPVFSAPGVHCRDLCQEDLACNTTGNIIVNV